MRIGFSAALVIALLTAGCVLFEEPDSTSEEQGVAERDPAEYAEQVDAKLRHYAACRDALASVMNESWTRYEDQVELGGKLARRREGVYVRGIDTASFRSCRRTIAAAPLSPPELPRIEQVAINLVSAAEQYAATTRTLATWLDTRTDRDDWSKLVELDPKLRESYQRWAEADAALSEALDLRHFENDPILLGVLEGRRSPLEVATRRLMVRARPIVRCLTRKPPASAEECQPLWDEFELAHEQFEQLRTSDRAAADKVFWMRTFALDVQEFHELAAEHQRKLGQRGKGKERDVQDLVDAYSALARDADALDFDFP